jgi:beta-lactamase superfamily II metal-dependent hydrolase
MNALRASLRIALVSSLVTFLATPTISFSAQVTPANKVKESIVVREEASSDSIEVGRLLKGERAQLLESVPYWYKVQLPNGQPGYVAKAWSEFLPDTGGLPLAFKIHFLDVGTGDSAIIDIGDKEIIIDGGDSLTGLHEYAKKEEIIQGAIELVVVTHGDADHWKGRARLLNHDGKATAPRTLIEFWEPGYDRACGPLESYDNFINKVRSQVSGTFKPASRGFPFTFH